MENLYKLNEYSGKLPNPKSFPIQGSNIISIRDMPNTFTDGYMVDLSVKESDKLILDEKATKEKGKSSISDLLVEANKSELLLSEPEFIYDFFAPAYVLFTPDGRPAIIQVKYYKYLRNRYKDCKFYLRHEAGCLISIKVNKEVVGLCMLLSYEKVTFGKIKEERK